MTARKQRLSELHKASLKLCQVLHSLFQVHFQPFFLKKADRLAEDHLLIDKIFPETFPQDKKVVHNAESLHEMALLLDQRHLVGLAAAVGVAIYNVSVIPHGSQADRIVPADQIHHLFLAFPVPSHQANDLPGKHLEFQIIQEQLSVPFKIDMRYPKKFFSHRHPP